jgi:hypothetical protein
MNSMTFKSIFLTLLLSTFHQNGHSRELFAQVQTFVIPEAQQGVAVDEKFIYAIASRTVAKYEKQTGRFIKCWQSDTTFPLIHLDSGVVVDGKLYCAHSNYPEFPMTSSVEIWDTTTLQHIDTHSFGLDWGSCTWIDRFAERWWAVFSHYDRYQQKFGKDNRWTVLVQFNDNWQALSSWVFPDSLLQRFKPMSNSGGSWGADSLLYVTGHNEAQLYVLQLPKAGSILHWLTTLPLDIDGQGLAWDRGKPFRLYGINRQAHEVRVFRFEKNEP